MGGSGPAWQAIYQDPLRCRPDGAAEEFGIQGEPHVEEINNELCSVKLVMMHRPTHEPQREKSLEYPFSWHLSSRRRLWELRIQLRFHQVPQNKVYFGIELERFVPLSTMTRQAQKALVGACQRVVGDCYHSNGDDPAKVRGEAEAPVFVMPLWAFDQFHVAEEGQEPSLLGDLDTVGMKRSDGVSKYIAAMRALTTSFSTDKVYTFCFWGISKFLDIMRWEVVGGLVPGVKLDFNKLCGSPPVYVTMYEMQEQECQGADRRHLASRRKQYVRAAVWSTLKPPSADAAAAAAAQAQDTSSDPGFDYWSGMTGYEGFETDATAPDSSPLVSPPCQQQEDLLGLDFSPPAASIAGPPKAGKADVSVDLLGLDFS